MSMSAASRDNGARISQLKFTEFIKVKKKGGEIYKGTFLKRERDAALVFMAISVRTNVVPCSDFVHVHGPLK